MAMLFTERRLRLAHFSDKVCRGWPFNDQIPASYGFCPQKTPLP